MKLVIDTVEATLTRVDQETSTTLPLYSKQAFEALSLEWVRVGWSLKYYHNFSWLGMPILQLPEDMIRLQEVIYRVRPKLIIETGVFLGGSLLFHASLLQMLGGGHVIGIEYAPCDDVRKAVAEHSLAQHISIIEGDSAAPAVVERVKAMAAGVSPVLVILDSDHSYAHVIRELEAYAPLVTPGSYIVATDGIMRDLTDLPRAEESWKTDNPYTAACAFAAKHPEFRQQQPAWPFHDGELTENVTYWPGAWLERLAL